jgi:NAD(P)-dependent dehydrogenase (short-subunit alcohol dehydrogenase family)
MKKTVLITGANSGVGKALSLICAKAGYTVVMVCRNKSKGENAQKEIIVKSKSDSVNLLIADLSSIGSIDSLGNEFKNKFDRLDVLVNNAGLSLPKREISVDGFEKVFATNHIGYFHLTNLLLDVLKSQPHSRIINVASQAQQSIDFDDLMSEKNYNQYRTYGRSKMANILFTYELAERLKDTGITVNCVHPGVVRTNIYDNVPFGVKILITLMKPFFISSESSANNIFPLISSDKFDNITGKYFIKGIETKSKNGSENKEDWKRLWRLTETLINSKEIV